MWVKTLKVFEIFNIYLKPLSRKRGGRTFGGPAPLFLFSLRFRLLLCCGLHVTLGAPSGPGRLLGLLGLVVTPLAVFVIGVLGCEGLSLGLGLVAIFTELAGGFALLPGVVTFEAIDLQGLRMLLMSEFDLSIRNIEDHLILCGEDARCHQDGENKTRQNRQT